MLNIILGTLISFVAKMPIHLFSGKECCGHLGKQSLVINGRLEMVGLLDFRRTFDLVMHLLLSSIGIFILWLIGKPRL
jgi:hypothetical protein